MLRNPFRQKLVDIRTEILEDAEKYGDERRSAIVERTAAQALDESALIPTEALTIVLSKKGWVRAAKGHDIDPATLNFKDGDAYQSSALERTNTGNITCASPLTDNNALPFLLRVNISSNLQTNP